jgi:hypothetical protein
MKYFKIREQITVAFMLGLELLFFECWLQLANKSLWDYIAPLIPTLIH